MTCSPLCQIKDIKKYQRQWKEETGKEISLEKANALL